MTYKTWLKHLCIRILERRRRWAPTLALLLLFWRQGGHATPIAVGFALILAVWFLVKVYVPIVGQVTDLIGKGAAWVARWDPDIAQMLGMMLGILVLIGSFAGGGWLLIGVITGSKWLPEHTVSLLKKFGFRADEEIVSVLLIVLFIVLGIVVLMISTYYYLKGLQAALNDPDFDISEAERDDGLKVLDVMRSIDDGLHEYFWALMTVAVALIPAMLRASWVPNVLAAVALPAFVVWVRRNYALRNNDPKPFGEAKVIKKQRDPLVRSIAGCGLFFVGSFSIPSIIVICMPSSTWDERAFSILFLLVAGSLIDVIWPYRSKYRDTYDLTEESCNTQYRARGEQLTLDLDFDESRPVFGSAAPAEETNLIK